MPGLLDIIRERVPTDYKEFDRIDTLARQFGTSDKAAAQLVNTGPHSLTENEAYDMIYRGVMDLSRQMGNALDKLYEKLGVAFDLEHTPRANVSHDLKQQQENVVQSELKGRKPAPWMRNADISADPNYRNRALVDAAQNLRNDPSKFSEHLATAVRAELTYQLALRMKKNMAPKPDAPGLKQEIKYTPPPPKPRPYGMK